MNQHRDGGQELEPRADERARDLVDLAEVRARDLERQRNHAARPRKRVDRQRALVDEEFDGGG